jgi:tetratricopeptide (TPR) repeat protein
MFSKLLLDEDSAELHDAGKRHSRHFLSVLARTKNLYLTDLFHASKMLETNWENVQAGWSWAASRYETDDEAARLCIDYLSAGEPWLNFRFTAEEHTEWAWTAVHAARCLDDASAEAHSLSRLAVAYQSAARLGEAKECYEAAAEKFRELGDRRGEGRTIADLGTYFKVTGDAVSAERCYKEQIAITQEFKDRRNEAAARGNLGLTIRRSARYLLLPRYTSELTTGEKKLAPGPIWAPCT